MLNADCSVLQPTTSTDTGSSPVSPLDRSEIVECADPSYVGTFLNGDNADAHRCTPRSDLVQSDAAVPSAAHVLH